MHTSRHGQRGAVLTLAIIIAVLGAIASMTMLQLAYYQSLHARFHRLHTAAQYAAEAGIVWGQQRLLSDPNYCGAQDPPPAMFNPPATVDVTVTNCVPPNPPGTNHVVSARVVY